jgi:hypothetical protein
VDAITGSAPQSTGHRRRQSREYGAWAAGQDGNPVPLHRGQGSVVRRDDTGGGQLPLPVMYQPAQPAVAQQRDGLGPGEDAVLAGQKVSQVGSLGWRQRVERAQHLSQSWHTTTPGQQSVDSCG